MTKSKSIGSSCFLNLANETLKSGSIKSKYKVTRSHPKVDDDIEFSID